MWNPLQKEGWIHGRIGCHIKGKEKRAELGSAAMSIALKDIREIRVGYANDIFPYLFRNKV